MSHFRSVLQLRRVQVWILVLACLALGLAWVPLVNLLAFEFCFVFAILGSMAALHLGSVQVAFLRTTNLPILLALRPPTPALLGLLGRITATNLLLLVLPLAIISLNGLRVQNCDFAEGLLLFFMLPILSVIIASSVGALWALTIPRAALATTCALGTLLFILIWGIYRFYDAPPIFGYDPFAGYFPGTLYDEDVSLRSPFFIYRTYNLLWLAGLVLGAAHLFEPVTLRLRWSRRRLGVALTLSTAVCLTAGVTLFCLRAPLGFAHNASSIQAALGGKQRTAHFDIYHPTELSPQEVTLLAQDLEFRYAQLTATFNAAPPRISTYFFRNAEEKRGLMGAGNTFIAKPWRNEIYLQYQGFPHRVLKHELAHIFAGLWGDSLFKVSLAWRSAPLPHPVFNVGLIEGLAVAADWRPYGELTGHQMAAALQRIGLSPSLEALFGHGFLAQASSRSYISAGSFCRYLMERHGIKKLTALYRSGGDFPAIYGHPLSTLLEKWIAYLKTVQIPPLQLQLAHETFRQPSILKRICGHEVANLRAQAETLLGENKTEPALEVLGRICLLDPGDPAHLIERMMVLVQAQHPRQAVAQGKQLLALPTLSKPLRRHTLDLLGDLAWRSGEVPAAKERYAQAAAYAGTPPQRRILHLKQWALHQPEEIQTILREYLLASDQQRDGVRDIHLSYRLAHALPRSGLGLYLMGKILVAHKHWTLAITPLREALRLGLPNNDFSREAQVVLGSCYLIAGNLAQAIPIFAEMADLEPPQSGSALEANDWYQRALWSKTGQIDPGKEIKKQLFQ